MNQKGIVETLIFLVLCTIVVFFLDRTLLASIENELLKSGLIALCAGLISYVVSRLVKQKH